MLDANALSRIDDPVLMLDRDGVVVMLNDAAARMIGRVADELVGRTLWDLLPATVASEIEERCRWASEGQVVTEFETYDERRQTWYAVRLCPDAGGLTVQYRDVPARGRDDGHEREELERSKGAEARYRHLVDGMAEGVAETTLAGDFVVVNRSLADMLGFDSAEDLMARAPNATNLYAETAQQTSEAERAVEETLAPGEPARPVDLEFSKKDGTTAWFRVRSTQMRTAWGEATGYQTIYEDITESRRTRQQLAAIVDGSVDAIISVTVGGTVTSWNRGAEGLFGFSAPEIVGQPIALIAPADRTVEQAQLRERLAVGGGKERLETVRCRKDGDVVPVLITASASSDDAGNVVGLSLIARNIADQQAARGALQLSEYRISEAQRVAHLGSFAPDVQSGTLTWSAEFLRILGLSP